MAYNGIEYISGQGIHYPLQGHFLQIKDTNFHEYSYDLMSIQLETGDLLQGFRKKATTIPIQLAFTGSLARREHMIQELHRAFTKDRIELNPGMILFNGWQLKGFMISEKVYPDRDNESTLNDVSFYAPVPYWEKEERFHFYKNSEIAIETQTGDYPFEYQELDYNRDKKGIARFTNPSGAPADYLLRVYGPINYPKIEINRREISVRTLLEAGEYLEIDSRNRTVITTRLKGDKVNQFHFRDLEHDIFQMIDPGQNDVTWNGNFEMDLYLRYRRDYPEWEDL